jgi:peptidoglycan/xylan/chitin deacetylase (PgdA/CDA1 family)
MWVVLACAATLALVLWPATGGLGVAAATLLALTLVLHGAVVPGSPFLLPSVRRGPRTGRRVSLTFDDGPHPVFTPRVLEVLARHGAHATFFLIGRWASAHPDLVRRIVAEGHTVGSHTHTHPRNAAILPPRRIAREIREGMRAIADATGHLPRLYRQPMGVVNRWIGPALREAGVTLVAWSRHAHDNRPRPDAAAEAERLAARLRPGDIVCLHDGDDRDPGGAECARRRTYTLAVLQALLPAMARGGLSSVPVEELIGAGPSLLGDAGPQAPHAPAESATGGGG